MRLAAGSEPARHPEEEAPPHARDRVGRAREVGDLVGHVVDPAVEGHLVGRIEREGEVVDPVIRREARRTELEVDAFDLHHRGDRGGLDILHPVVEGEVAFKLVGDALGKSDLPPLVNAWNEWTEGAAIEPCAYLGRSYLDAVTAVTDGYK